MAISLTQQLYIVFSTFIYRPAFLLASIKVCFFSVLYLCHLPVDLCHQHTPEADVWHLISVTPDFSWTILMAYSKAKLKSSGDKASPCFILFWIGKISEKCLRIQTLLFFLFRHTLINLTSFMGTPDSMRILYNTSILAESYAFLKPMNICFVSSFCRMQNI
jgi:hypothetical protein